MSVLPLPYRGEPHRGLNFLGGNMTVNDKEVLIDQADLPLASQYKWHIADSNGILYVRTNKGLMLHRLLMDFPEEVDHINGNGLDNRRRNLRAVTHTQNMQNRRRHKNNKTDLKGVQREKGRNRYKVRITANKTVYRLGAYQTREEAGLVYDIASSLLHKDYGRANNPISLLVASPEMVSKVQDRIHTIQSR